MLKQFFQQFDIEEGMPRKAKIAMEIILVILLSAVIGIARIKLAINSIELYFIVVSCALIFSMIHTFIWINKNNKKEQVKFFIECIYYIIMITAISVFGAIFYQGLVYYFVAILFATLGGSFFSTYLKKALSKY